MEIGQVIKGKRRREELRLPQLHFVVIDDWIPKLGDKAFNFWLKLHTLVDRTDADRQFDRIKMSVTKLAKKTEMAKSTLQNRLKPLYEYGLIDFLDYEDSKLEGCKPVNIIVYEYPCNDYYRATEKLEKVRDWDKRTDEKYSYAKKGGKPKGKIKSKIIEEFLKLIDSDSDVDLAIRKTVIENLQIYVELKVDIKVLWNWIKIRSKKQHISLTIKQLEKLSEWTSPVKNTLATLNYLSSLQKPNMNQIKQEKDNIPIYNWLEENS